MTVRVSDDQVTLHASVEPLDITGLKTYFYTYQGVVKAIDGVSLALRKGETLGVVGESGSGKSVLPASILQILQPPGRIVDGSVRLFGKELVGLSEEEMAKIRGRRIAMIVPNARAGLNPLLQVGHQLCNVFRAHFPINHEEAWNRSIDMLRNVGIPDPQRRMHNYPNELSGGMAQRAVIAMAFACSPEVLLADEPTFGLDVTIQAQVMDLMQDLLTKRDLSTLIATRDLGIVANYCDTVAVLYAGKIMELAPARVFFKSPRHPYSIALYDSVAAQHRGRKRKEAIVHPPITVSRPEGDVEPPLEEIAPGHWVRATE